MYAVEEGAIEATRCLLRKNANMNLCNADGLSILHIAALHNQLGVLEVLMIFFLLKCETKISFLFFSDNI